MTDARTQTPRTDEALERFAEEGAFAIFPLMRQMERELATARAAVSNMRLDAMTLALRLMGESDDSFAPETRDVMKRFRPMCEALLRGEENE